MSRLEFLHNLFGKKSIDGGLPKALVGALEMCSRANEIRDKHIAGLRDFCAELKSEGRLDELEEIEYQIDLAHWTLTEAQEQARYRLDYIRALDTESKRQDELTLCATRPEGTLHFINTWCWTLDPRMPITTLPFKLFAKQEEYIKWLDTITFKYRQPGLTDKSRDMGVTWCIDADTVKHWLFEPRFDSLVGSKSEDFVDRKGREDTLMEKMRYIIRLLPTWMLPEGFEIEKHMPWMNILNPATGSFIAGESANENFGRQGRYTRLFIDEFPVFPEGGYAAWTACSQSSPVRLVVGTPKGKLNKFAELRHNSKIRTFSFHWKDHPRKDDRWYRAQSATMTDAEKAQELDIDYDASQAGLVFPEWDPLYSVITWSEFAAVYGDRARDMDGNPRIPADWLLMQSMDVGNTIDHRWVTTWAARPGVRDPFNDTVFLYRQFMAPLNMSPSDIGECIKDFEKPWKEDKRMDVRYIGHTDDTEVKVFEEQGLDFSKRSTDYNAGISAMRNYMKIIDRDKPNPFLAHLKDPEGKQIMGRSRWVLIVDDDEGRKKWDHGMRKWLVAEPTSDAGFLRGRVEVQMYHYPESEKGKPVRLMRPHKAVDDAMDTWRDIGIELPPLAPLTEAELIDKQLPEGLRRSDLASKVDPEQLSRLWLTREIEKAEIVIPKNEHWRRAMFKRQRGNI